MLETAALPSRDAIGRRVARMMLEVGAIHVRPEEPLKWVWIS